MEPSRYRNSINVFRYLKKSLSIAASDTFSELLFLLLLFPPAFVAVFVMTSLSSLLFVAVAVAGASTVLVTLKLRLMFVTGPV